MPTDDDDADREGVDRDGADRGVARAAAPVPLDHPWRRSRDDWLEIARGVQRDLATHNTALLSAGISFQAFLAMFPTLIVVVTSMALARPAADLEFQARRLTIGLPELGRQVITSQVGDIVQADNDGLQIAFLVSLSIALWAATSAIQGTMTALTAIHHAVEDRTWRQQRLLAVRLTAGAIPFLVVSVAMITGVPILMRRLGMGGLAGAAGVFATLVVLALMMVSALTVLYRVGPAQPPTRSTWASVGAVLATFLWLVGTEAFRLVVENVGTYDARYGAVAGVAVIMLWLWLTSWCVLLGATVNNQLEHPGASGAPEGSAQA